MAGAVERTDCGPRGRLRAVSREREGRHRYETEDGRDARRRRAKCAGKHPSGTLRCSGNTKRVDDALEGAPLDVSAGVITAAGMFHLARACAAVAGSCHQSAYWADQAREILQDSLSHFRKIAPVGILGDMTYTLLGRESWDDESEMIFGLNYALEAIKLSRDTYN